MSLPTFFYLHVTDCYTTRLVSWWISDNPSDPKVGPETDRNVEDVHIGKEDVDLHPKG